MAQDDGKAKDKPVAEVHVDADTEAEKPGRARRAAPTAGAYILDPQPDGSELSDYLFAFNLKDATVAPPKWQRELHTEIQELYAFVLNADITKVEDKQTRLDWLIKIYSTACVQMPAQSSAPHGAEDAARSLSAYRRRLLSDLLQDMEYRIRLHRYWILGSCLLLAAIGAALVKGIGLNPVTEVGNYTLVAAASMAGLFVYDMTIPRLVELDDYEPVRRRYRDAPHVRVVGTCLVSVVVALAVASGVVTIKLGEWSSSDLPTKTSIALLVGFVAGSPGSLVVKKFWKWVTSEDNASRTARKGKAAET